MKKDKKIIKQENNTTLATLLKYLDLPRCCYPGQDEPFSLESLSNNKNITLDKNIENLLQYFDNKHIYLLTRWLERNKTHLNEPFTLQNININNSPYALKIA